MRLVPLSKMLSFKTIKEYLLNKSSIFIIITALLFSQATFSSDESKAEAEILLDSMDMKIALEQSIEQMLNLQLQQDPALVPYKEVMLKFFSKHMSYESLKPQMIDMYAKAFTASELKDINAFYGTPTGKKTLAKMPELMAQGGQIGAQRIQGNIQELQDMIKEESERIQKLQAK